MNIYIVTYQSDIVETTISALSEIGERFNLIQDVFLLKTTLSTVEVRDYLRERGSASKVFVSSIAHDAAWSNVNINSQIIKDIYSEL